MTDFAMVASGLQMSYQSPWLQRSVVVSTASLSNTAMSCYVEHNTDDRTILFYTSAIYFIN